VGVREYIPSNMPFGPLTPFRQEITAHPSQAGFLAFVPATISQ
jgi:hypothetical protein